MITCLSIPLEGPILDTAGVVPLKGFPAIAVDAAGALSQLEKQQQHQENKFYMTQLYTTVIVLCPQMLGALARLDKHIK